LKEQIEKGVYDKEKTEEFQNQIDEFDPEEYPVEIPDEVELASCQIFGHMCPVFMVNEPFTETTGMRKITRHIPRAMFLRIVRRDNQTCQECGKVLKDDEIEIDHIIPFSLGGPTEEHNLRVMCTDCNSSKQASVEL